MSNIKDALRRAELRRFMKDDIESIVAAAGKQERDRMCARAIHWAVIRARCSSSVVNIIGR